MRTLVATPDPEPLPRITWVTTTSTSHPVRVWPTAATVTVHDWYPAPPNWFDGPARDTGRL